MNNFIHHSIYQHNWIVPRSVMCTLFWTGVILVFTGMILLVTSKHKGKMYESWGGVLLGLGLCVLLICLILCIHAYCVMAADAAAAEEEENVEPIPTNDAKTNPYSVGSGSSLGVCDFPQPVDAVDFYSGNNLVNGRKPRSMTELIPPPKFGVSVTKPQTHTVRFFLSEDEGATENGGRVEIQEKKTRPPNAETTRDIKKQESPLKSAPDVTSSSSGGKVSPSIDPPEYCAVSNMAVLKSEDVKANSVDQQINSDSRSPDRNFLSSDCDSLMSVETIIPRTLQRNPGEKRKLSAYDFPEAIRETAKGSHSEVNDYKSSGDPVQKSAGKPFPGPSSSTARGAKASRSSRQTPRHSHEKSQLPQKQYSSETTSPSPDVLDNPPLYDATPVSQKAVISRQSPAKQSASTAKPMATRFQHHHYPPQPQLGGLSITRSFGPSSVTVTPLGTHDAGVHRRHLDAGDEISEGMQASYLRHSQAANFKPGWRCRAEEEEETRFQAAGRDNRTWSSIDKQKQQSISNEKTSRQTSDRFPPMPRPPSSPTLLEITESKATVYDNVQYFQM